MPPEVVNTNWSQATVLAGVVIANIGAILGGCVAVIVKITRLETKMDRAENDVNALWERYRSETDSAPQRKIKIT